MLVAGLSVGVVLGELRDEFGINGVVAALHGSTFGIGLLVAGVWGVRLVDRIGRRARAADCCRRVLAVRRHAVLSRPGVAASRCSAPRSPVQAARCW